MRKWDDEKQEAFRSMWERGVPVKQIAWHMSVDPETVHRYRKKLGLASRRERLGNNSRRINMSLHDTLAQFAAERARIIGCQTITAYIRQLIRNDYLSRAQ
jgi:transposase-like protein